MRKKIVALASVLMVAFAAVAIANSVKTDGAGKEGCCKAKTECTQKDDKCACKEACKDCKCSKEGKESCCKKDEAKCTKDAGKKCPKSKK